MRPFPVRIKFHKQARILDVEFNTNQIFNFTCEYLRVFSPSAEVRGHGAGPAKLVLGKQNVTLVKIEPIGNYAIKLVFDDGHASGLYSWDLLYDLGIQQEKYWNEYLAKVVATGIKFL